MRGARPGTGRRVKACATDITYARAIIYVHQYHLHHLPRHTALAGQAFAILDVGTHVAIKAVHKSTLVELDFVTVLPILYCANANTLARFIFSFLNK
ncbi:hypothetical protein F2Q69_00009857 [Brassica cretica]|uniref:Uncharacterized protein n=1 Tax=Brassica cretica TaxID=69181 RepID=A0A8S9PEN6_BRACR|nr:hypothetical protein F2Q69_00009857 [Brassica cretica]